MGQLDTGIFVALINPGIALTFAATYLLLWHHQEHKPYILMMAGAFLAICFGFLLQYFTVYDETHSKLVSNLLFLAGGVGIATGALARYDRSVPVRPIAIAATVGFAAFAWFLYVQPSISLRIYAINYAFGAITLLIAAELRLVPQRRLIDNVLLGLTVFWGVSFFIRPIVVMWIEGPYESYAQYHQSLYWYSLTLSSALFMLLVALNTVCALALDVMEELRHESQTDALSGLLNRRGFEEKAREELRAASRNRRPVTLIVCDLDHFKAINDTHGHAVGDLVIKSFAQRLVSDIGPGHVVARIGGEEFSILLCGANADTGRLFAEGVRTVFGTVPLPGLPEHLQKTASFGVAEWSHGESIEELFVRADDALYRAKKDGRNLVRVASLPSVSGHAPLSASGAR